MPPRLLNSPSRRKAPASACARPDPPLITAVSGRITGSVRNRASSRVSRGNRPARRKDDLPEPEAPSTTISGSTPSSIMPRMRSRPRTIMASRPKKIAASSGSSARSPRYGERVGSPGGGHGKVRASRPARSRPRRSMSRPTVLNETCWRDVSGPTSKLRVASPFARSHSCHSAVISTGTRSSGTVSTISPKMRLCNVFASRNSARHHLDSTHAGDSK